MRTRWIAALGVSLGAAFGSRAFASQVTYTVDPAQSQLNLSGTYLGQEFVPFSSVNSDGTSVDGLISPFAGTIDADRDAAAGTIQITGGTISSTGPDFYSVPPGADFIFAIPGNTSSYQITIRDMSLSLSGPLTSGTNFDTAQILADFTSGEVDYQQFTYPPGDPLNPILTSSGVAFITGSATLDSNLGTLTTGASETLKIPTTVNVEVTINGQPLALELSGNITASVPEPETIAALICAVPFLLFRNRRRKS